MNGSWKYFIRKLFVVVFIFLFHVSYTQENKNQLELYGFIMTDIGYNFNAIDPQWFDVMRPTKLPSYKGQFAPGGNAFFSIRQSRFGVKSLISTPLGELTTQFDFDFIGFGKYTGQTHFHVINAYGQCGKFGMGQTPSAFMDVNVFPVTLDYWGPSSRTFYLNVQIRYMPIQKDNERLTFALERPGGTSDGGDYKESILLQDVHPVFNFPNITAHYRNGNDWGHVQVGGIIKKFKWEDNNDSSGYNLSGRTTGWGCNLSTVIHATKFATIKFQAVYGKGIGNYMADVLPDIVLQSKTGDPTQPFYGKALPVFGFFSFIEINWNKFLKSSMGYSSETADNSDLQSADAFRKGRYGLINLRYYPVDNVMAGIEYQYGQRKNFTDGFQSTGNRFQLTAKINFSKKFLSD